MFDNNTQQTKRGSMSDNQRCALLASGVDTAPILEALRRVPNTRSVCGM